MSKLEALRALEQKVAAGEVVQSHEASMIWPTYYDKEAKENVLIWDYACRASQGSLDAALSLHQAVLPGWDWGRMPSIGGMYVFDYEGNSDGRGRAEGECPARTLLLAIIRALIAQEEQG